MNLADAGVALVLTALVINGLGRGLIGQCLLLAATLLSFVVAAVIAYLVATHPGAGHGLALLAVPVAFFVTLFPAWWVLTLVARGLTGIVHRLPIATLDRLLGALVSIAVGVLSLSLLVLGLVGIERDLPVVREVRAAWSTPLLLEAGRRTASAGASHLEFLRPLARRFEAFDAGDIGDTL